MDIQKIFSIVVQLLERHQWLGDFINVLLKSTVVFLVVLIITFSFRKYSAAARHLMWCVALISLLLLPFIISLVPAMELVVSGTTAELISGNEENLLLVQAFDEQFSYWAMLLKYLYVGVACCLIAYTLLGIVRVHLLTVAARPVQAESSVSELENILHEEGIFTNIRILENASLLSPLSWGIVNPVILLPVQARAWSREKLRNVLIHEVCHIQRLDWLSHIVSRLALAMYWYNPLIWYASKRLGQEAEQACDDAVVLYGRCQADYASDLLEIAKNVNHKGHRHILAEAIAHSFLGSRVVAILDSGRVRNKTEGVWVIRCLLVTLTLVGIIASLRVVPEVKLAVVSNTFENVLRINYISAQADAVEEPDAEELARAYRPEREEVVFANILSSNRITQSAALTVGSAEGLREGIPAVNTEIVMPDISLDIVQIAYDDSPVPRQIKSVNPDYPLQASSRGLEGYSVVEYDISNNGRVINPVIIDSSPGAVFHQSSLQAVKRFIYEPPIANGESVEIKGLRTRFIYQLDPGPG